MIRYTFYLGIGRGELIIWTPGLLYPPQLRFTTSSGDIYTGTHHSSDHCEYMFKIEPTLEHVSSDDISFVFKENYHRYPDVTVQLYKLSAEDAARQRATAASVDEIINHILTKKFIAGERSPILEKVR